MTGKQCKPVPVPVPDVMQTVAQTQGVKVIHNGLLCTTLLHQWGKAVFFLLLFLSLQTRHTVLEQT